MKNTDRYEIIFFLAIGFFGVLGYIFGDNLSIVKSYQPFLFILGLMIPFSITKWLFLHNGIAEESLILRRLILITLILSVAKATCLLSPQHIITQTFHTITNQCLFLTVGIFLLFLLKGTHHIFSAMGLIILIPLSTRLANSAHYLDLFFFSGNQSKTYIWPLFPWISVFLVSQILVSFQSTKTKIGATVFLIALMSTDMYSSRFLLHPFNIEIFSTYSFLDVVTRYLVLFALLQISLNFTLGAITYLFTIAKIEEKVRPPH